MFIRVRPTEDCYIRFMIINTDHIVDIVEDTKRISLSNKFSFSLTEESYNYLCNQLGVTSGV